LLVYIVRRLFATVPVLFGVTLVIFILTFVAPGDPVLALFGQPRADPETVASIRREYNLDKPYPVQYFLYVGKLLRGDLGRSYRQRLKVSEIILDRLPKTARLTVAAMVIAISVGVIAGIISAVKQYSFIDGIVMVGSLLGVSTPVFWSGMMLILVFSSVLHDQIPLIKYIPRLPISGYGGGDLRYLILPAAALGLLSMGYIARMTRSSMLEIIRQDYVRTARAKGLAERVVIYRHTLKNALIPVATVLGLTFADLLTGAPLTESVFAWPGMGRAIVAAVQVRDLPVVMGISLFFALIYIFVNLIVDISYAYLDPRIRYD
jgi:peptide/nickel transport system permease protein